MALNKDVLGLALYTRSAGFNDVEIDVTDPAAMEVYRKNFWMAIADEVINHFKNNGELHVPGIGLVAGSTAVTGNSMTGTIQ